MPLIAAQSKESYDVNMGFRHNDEGPRNRPSGIMYVREANGLQSSQTMSSFSSEEEDERYKLPFRAW